MKLSKLCWILVAGLVYCQGAEAGRIEELQEAIRLDSKNASNYFNLGILYLQANKVEKALPNFERAAKLDKKDKEAIFLAEHCRGLLSYYSKDYKKAIPSFEKARKYKPDDTDNLKFLAFAYYSVGKAKDAKSVIDAFEKTGQQDAPLKFILGMMKERYEKDLDSAVVEYEAALEIQPGYAPAREAVARALVNLKKYEQSLGHLEKILEEKPGHPMATTYLGVAHHRLGNRAQGIRYYKEAARLKPKDTLILYNLAMLYSDSGEFENALDSLTKLRQISPSDTQAQNLKVEILLAAVIQLKQEASNKSLEGDLLGAKQAYEKILKLERDNNDARTNLRQLAQKIGDEVARLRKDGEAAIGAGNTAEAIQSWNQALALDPDNKAVKAQLKNMRAEKDETLKAYVKQGDEELRLGNYQKAEKQYRKALEIDPSFTEAKQKIKNSRDRRIKVLKNLIRDATALADSKKYTEAIQAFEEVLALDPRRKAAKDRIFSLRNERRNQVDKYIAQGLAAAKAGKSKEAGKKFNAALNIDPTNARARRELKKATGVKKAAVVQTYENVQNLYFEGMKHYTQDNLDKALSVWQKAKKLNPNDQKIKKAIAKVKTKLEFLKRL